MFYAFILRRNEYIAIKPFAQQARGWFQVGGLDLLVPCGPRSSEVCAFVEMDESAGDMYRPPSSQSSLHRPRPGNFYPHLALEASCTGLAQGSPHYRNRYLHLVLGNSKELRQAAV